MKKLLKDLIAFKSFTPAEINRCIDYIHDDLKKKEIPCEVLTNEGLKILVATVGQGSRCLILNAHIDVVENDPKKFSLKEEGDRLIGPGIFDMKGSAAVIMELLKEIDRTKLKGKIMVQFVPDEEVGGDKGTGYLARKGYTGDFIVCCEPTHLNISVQSKGVYFAKVPLKGRAAHGSRPWLGDNAILKSFRLYDELQKLPFLKESSPLFKMATINLTKIQGGDSINKVPDHCEISLDIRYLPEQDRREVLRQIQSVCQQFETEAKILSEADPVVTPIDHPLVQQLHKICLKHDPKVILFGQDGSSDARFYTPLGVPGIEFGPAGGGQHSADEFIDYPKLLLYKEMLREFILSFGESSTGTG